MLNWDEDRIEGVSTLTYGRQYIGEVVLAKDILGRWVTLRGLYGEGCRIERKGNI